MNDDLKQKLAAAEAAEADAAKALDAARAAHDAEAARLAATHHELEAQQELLVRTDPDDKTFAKVQAARNSCRDRVEALQHRLGVAKTALAAAGEAHAAALLARDALALAALDAEVRADEEAVIQLALEAEQTLGARFMRHKELADEANRAHVSIRQRRGEANPGVNARSRLHLADLGDILGSARDALTAYRLRERERALEGEREAAMAARDYEAALKLRDEVVAQDASRQRFRERMRQSVAYSESPRAADRGGLVPESAGAADGGLVSELSLERGDS